MTPTQLTRVLLHADFELDRLNSALKRLRSYDFPSSVAERLIDDIFALNEESIESLQAIESDATVDPIGAGERVVTEYRKIMHRRRHLQVLEDAKSDDVPWSLVPSIEKIAETVLPGRRVLITTTPDMNYMVGWSPINVNSIATIYLPKLHRANAFLHVLIAHELFHPVVEQFVGQIAAPVMPTLKSRCKALLESTKGPTDLFSQPRLDAFLNYAEKQLQQCIRECMCDMGAVSLFGPAALWTISGFAATQNLDASPTHENQFYPPWRMRIQRAYEYLAECAGGAARLNELQELLRDSGFEMHADVLQASLKVEEEVFRGQPTPATTGDDLTKIVYSEIESVFDECRQRVTQITCDLKDTWGNTIEEVPILLNRLALGVPPTEVFSDDARNAAPGSTSAIILACWIERLACEESGTFDLRSYRRLCRLMLKALEDSELKREYVRWTETEQ